MLLTTSVHSDLVGEKWGITTESSPVCYTFSRRKALCYPAADVAKSVSTKLPSSGKVSAMFQTIRIYQCIYPTFICATSQRSPSTLPTLCGALAKWAMEAHRLHGTSSDERRTEWQCNPPMLFRCKLPCCGGPCSQRLYRDVIFATAAKLIQCRWEGRCSAAGTSPEGAWAVGQCSICAGSESLCNERAHVIDLATHSFLCFLPLQPSSFYTGNWYVQECEIPRVKMDLSLSLSL